MPHEYTRQRQGRDFLLHDILTAILPANLTQDDDTQKGEVSKLSLAQRLEHYKEEAERNAVPIDGHEPSEKGRNLI